MVQVALEVVADREDPAAVGPDEGDEGDDQGDPEASLQAFATLLSRQGASPETCPSLRRWKPTLQLES